MPLIKNALFVMMGGSLGSLARYLISVLIPFDTRSPFPYRTLFVNLVGSFLIGFVVSRFQQHIFSHTIRLLIVVGFLGAFTTFSTLSYDTIRLLNSGHARTALLNLAITITGGLIAVLAGLWLGKSH